MRDGRAVHRKDGHAFSDVLFHRPDDPAFGDEKNDRMPELQGAVSDRVEMKFTFLLFVVLFSSCFQNRPPKLIIPEPKIDEIFTGFVNPITDKYGIMKLRETSLSDNDFEVRVWLSASQTDGFIVKRIDNDWSAIALKEIDCSKDIKSYKLGKIELGEPKSGWENTWQKLSDAEILSLPDSSELPNKKRILDGIVYSVEINKNGVYRTYYYSNPQFQEWREAGQMKKNR